MIHCRFALKVLRIFHVLRMLAFGFIAGMAVRPAAAQDAPVEVPQKILSNRDGETTWQRAAGKLTETLAEWWNYPILGMEDNTITFGKLLAAVFLVLVGLYIARRLSSHVGKKLLAKIHLNPGVAAAVESLTFYFLVVFFTLFALHLVHVPLTMFTFLGGALAIGLGFGSQNLINNFISGLIVLLEQPIRVGDVIELDGVQGRVQTIGARSTKILTGNNVHVIVPNSIFLEKTVTNWTLVDDKVRASINVGVAYDAPVEKVIEILTEIVVRSPDVLSDPAPLVVLSSFAEGALVFTVHFSIRLDGATGRAKVESDLRLSILKHLQAAGISIPYAYREVHVNIAPPVRVQLSREKV